MFPVKILANSRTYMRRDYIPCWPRMSYVDSDEKKMACSFFTRNRNQGYLITLVNLVEVEERILVKGRNSVRGTKEDIFSELDILMERRQSLWEFQWNIGANKAVWTLIWLETGCWSGISSYLQESWTILKLGQQLSKMIPLSLESRAACKGGWVRAGCWIGKRVSQP